MQTKLKEKQNIPKGWQSERFGDRVRLQYGSSLPESKRAEGNVPVFGSNGIVGLHSESLVKGPGIIVGRKGTIGAAVLSQQDFWPIDTTYYVECDESIKLSWLYYKLQSLGLSKMNSASGTPGLNREEVYRLNILVPPPKEQRKIAEILRSVDEEIEKTKEVIKATEKLKKGLMQKLFAVDGDENEVKLKDIANVTSSKRIRRSEYVESGVPFYRSKEIIEKSRGKNHSLIYYISNERYSELKEKFGAPKIGDILITAVGTIGVIYLVEEEDFYFKDGNLLWLRDISDSADRMYLKYYLSSPVFQEQVLGASIGSSQKALTIEKLEKVKFPLPDLKRQTKNAEIFTAVDEKILINKKLLVKQTELKKGLMQDLLSGVKRVKV